MPATDVAVKPCTANMVRCANARSYRAVLRDCCRSHLIQISRDVAEAFRGAGVPFWLDYGSVLGGVRNPLTTRDDYPWLPAEDLPEGPIPPGIVPHDKDCDWGVPMKDWMTAHRVLFLLAQRKGYRLKVRQHNGSIKVCLSRLNMTNLDVFFWREYPDGRMARPKYIGVDNYKGKDITRDMLYPLETVEWEGMEMPVPHDPQAFCEHRYGPNWRTPVPANHDGVRR